MTLSWRKDGRAQIAESGRWLYMVEHAHADKGIESEVRHLWELTIYDTGEDHMPWGAQFRDQETARAYAERHANGEVSMDDET